MRVGWVGAAAAATPLIGSFMGWSTTDAVVRAFDDVEGIHGDGRFTVAGAAVVGLAMILGAITRKVALFVVALVASLGGLIVSAYDLTNLNDAYAEADAGVGLYVCTAGFVVTAMLSLTGAFTTDVG